MPGTTQLRRVGDWAEAGPKPSHPAVPLWYLQHRPMSPRGPETAEWTLTWREHHLRPVLASTILHGAPGSRCWSPGGKGRGKPTRRQGLQQHPGYVVHKPEMIDLQAGKTASRIPWYLWLFLFIYLFIYLWLCGVFASMRGLSLVAASGGPSSSRCAGLSLSQPLLLRSTSSRRAGSVVVAHGPSCSAACGTFLDQGSNPCPLHWQADSQPLRHQGSPWLFCLITLNSSGQLMGLGSGLVFARLAESQGSRGGWALPLGAPGP